MALLDHKGESEFPFKKETVYYAMCRAILTINGMKLHSSDKLSGRINVKSGVSLWSWGEDIPIQLISLSETKTKVIITSSPKTGVLLGGAFDMGKNRKNIETILSATSKLLSNLPPETKPEISSEENRINISVADEISKLKKLLDDGIITHDEFNQQKTRLLK